MESILRTLPQKYRKSLVDGIKEGAWENADPTEAAGFARKIDGPPGWHKR
jgi:hypothetical protein